MIAVRQDAQKPVQKFCARKPAKKERRTRFHAKTAEVGCVLGAGGRCSGCGRMGKQAQIDIGLVSPAGSVGAGRSPQATSAPRHAPQAGLRAHLVAKSYRTLTKKSGTAQAIPDFFGRGRRTWSPLRSARSLRATGTHSPLGTRFWSGCGRAHQGAEKGSVSPGSSRKSQRGWCWFGAAGKL